MSGYVLRCSVMSDSAIPWTVARQAPLSMGFSRPEYWSGLPSPSPGTLPDPRTTRSSVLQLDLLPFEAPGKQVNGVLKKIKVKSSWKRMEEGPRGAEDHHSE